MKKSKYLILLCMSALVLGGCTLTNGDSSSSSSASSSESSSTKEEGASIYALIGDFKDSSWIDSPSEGSSYYLDNSVTNYWERTVVTSSQDGSRDNARLAVVNYGTYDIVAGYSSLTSNSSGAFEDSGTNYIGLYWDSTYKVEIDFTNNSKSITIALVSGGPTEGGESGSSTESSQTESSNDDDKPKETGYYSLVGDFEDSSWEGFPQEGSKYRLEYTVGEDSTKYWTREVTIAAAPTTDDDWLEYGAWAAGFRIADVYWDAVSEENIWTTIAGYDALSTSSTGVENYTDSDNNIKLYYWGATYTLTIDLRDSANPSILVTYVSGGTHYEAGSTGDDEGNEKGYDSNYVLVGDFIDSSWDGWPSEDSEYYLGYNSNDNSTKYWEREVTIADEPTDNEWWDNPNTWNASFYVASVTWNGKEGEESEDNWTLIAGYNHLDSSSTGVLGSTDDGGIEVSWNATYKLVIDLRGDTPSILVTLVEDGGDSGYTGDDDEPGSGVSYDSNYVLTGDLVGASWIGWAEEGSDYYLGFNSNDPDSKYWERTITILEEPEDKTWWNPEGGSTWNAGFRVVSVYYDENETWTDDNGQTQYGADVWTTIAGYTELDTSKSSGYIGVGDDNNIAVTWGATYDVTIDCRGTTPVLTVNLASDTGDSGNTGDSGSGSGNTGDDEYTYGEPEDINRSATYYLVGDYNGGWDIGSAIKLTYDPNYSDSMYWQRTITTTSKVENTDYPGFRVVDSNWGAVANYTNLVVQSGSTGIMTGYYDGDNNIKLASWSTSYDITIDLRGSTYTVLVNYHDDSFDGTVDGLFDGSSVNKSASDYASLNVSDDYIMGVDISSIEEVESGSSNNKFYDENGTETDIFTLLKNQGINYVRIRLWNDPYVTVGDSTSASFGGGGNDITTDIKIAKRAVAAGMKICLDFHYSDFWVHPGQQIRPRSWASLDDNAVVSQAASWTTSILQEFQNNGCKPDMVQIGNETNDIQVAGFTRNSTVTSYSFLSSCASAVRGFDSSIQIVAHLSIASLSADNLITYFGSLSSVSYDIMGLSYYPYDHGSISNFKNILNSLANSNNSTVSSKKICLMEYSYGWTTGSPYGEKYGNAGNTFNASSAASGGYDASVAGQTKCIYEINEAIAALGDKGLGSFYWEPAWLANPGTCWASTDALTYYQTYIDSSYQASYLGNTSWSNQALFDFDGKALDSLNIFKAMK